MSTIIRLIIRKLIKVITKVYDPLINIKIGTEIIKVNLSHQLAEILKIYPEYNFNLARIVHYTEEHIGQISIIDIGANVGDTVAFIRNYSNAPILCIDGEENYVALLRKNVSRYKNVSVCHALVGTDNKAEKYTLKADKGTAHITESATTIQVRTLENILMEFPAFKNSKILKSDTDGFDTWILRSCSEYLKNHKPVLFFEFDPYFIRKNHDDPFDFIKYLKTIEYHYIIVYNNVGDLLIACSMNEDEILQQLIHYFSGRNVESFADICALHLTDEKLFREIVQKEIQHFKEVRKY